MATGSPLALLLPCLGETERAAAAADPDTESALVELLHAAKDAWPALDLAHDDFVAYVATKLAGTETAPLARALRELRAGDLYLAYGCSVGDARAIAAFEEGYMGEVDGAYVRIRVPVARDEARQQVRDRILVRHDDDPPRITLYAGRGELRNWFRVTVVRTLLNLATRQPKEVRLDDEALEKAAGRAMSPELAHLGRVYEAELRASFAEAVGSLTVRDRTLLRYTFCDQLTVDAVGALYDVHRATAARWIAKAREVLFERVRERLKSRLSVSEAEFASILRVLGSQFELTLSGFLRSNEPPR